MQNNRMNLFFQAEIPGKVGIKKNSRRNFRQATGRITSLPSKAYQIWESRCQFHILQANKKWQANRVTHPIIAHFEFHFKNRHALPDTSNCIEGVQDVMETMGIFKNDRQIFHVCAWRFVSGEAKTLVRLFKSDGGEQ